MKKFLIVSSVIGLIAGLTIATVSAAPINTAEERGYISVDASANTEIAPDVAEINIAVKTYDNKSLEKASQENKEISDKVYNAIKEMINKENGDYVKTANYSAVPIYSYNSSKKNFEKYEVSNNIIVHTKNVNKVGNIIDKAISLGATNVNSLNFSISNYENQCNDLLAIAAKKAKTRAEVLAKASSTYITGVKSINNSCSASNNQRVQYRLMAKNMMTDSASGTAAPEATPIQSGVIKIYANINASYFVK